KNPNKKCAPGGSPSLNNMAARKRRPQQFTAEIDWQSGEPAPRTCAAHCTFRGGKVNLLPATISGFAGRKVKADSPPCPLITFEKWMRGDLRNGDEWVEERKRIGQ